jgi:hypothetical protein
MVGSRAERSRRPCALLRARRLDTANSMDRRGARASREDPLTRATEIPAGAGPSDLPLRPRGSLPLTQRDSSDDLRGATRSPGGGDEAAGEMDPRGGSCRARRRARGSSGGDGSQVDRPKRRTCYGRWRWSEPHGCRDGLSQVLRRGGYDEIGGHQLAVSGGPAAQAISR